MVVGNEVRHNSSVPRPEGISIRVRHMPDTCLSSWKDVWLLSVERLSIICLDQLCSDELQSIPGLMFPGFPEKRAEDARCTHEWALESSLHPYAAHNSQVYQFSSSCYPSETIYTPEKFCFPLGISTVLRISRSEKIQKAGGGEDDFACGQHPSILTHQGDMCQVTASECLDSILLFLLKQRSALPVYHEG